MSADNTTVSSSATKWPELLIYSFDGTQALVATAKTYDDAIDFAKEAFPNQLTQIPNNRLGFWIVVREKVRIPSTMWKMVACGLPPESIVYIKVEQEGAEKRRPLNHCTISTADGEKDYAIVFALDQDNQVFVCPGYTHQEAVDVARDAFPSQLSDLPYHQISFSLRLLGGGKRLITPSAWRAAMAKYAIVDASENLYYTLNVHVEAQEQPATSGARPPEYVEFA